MNEAQRKPGQSDERWKTIYNYRHAALRPGHGRVGGVRIQGTSRSSTSRCQTCASCARETSSRPRSWICGHARRALKAAQPRRVHQWVPYSRISPHLKRAVLVAEDAGFWGHEGIDLVEIKKALETDWERGSLMRGASTITQQLAKNLYLSPTRNPFRKLSELLITRRLEHELSKTRIFELYLNDIEWGDGIWGAEAAARTYFGIPASAVGPDQAALMAGAIVNPRVLNIARPNARLRARQRIIRARMGNVTPPPVIARPAPAETPACGPSDPQELQREPTLDRNPNAQPSEPEPELQPEPAPVAPDRTQCTRTHPAPPSPDTVR